MASSCSDRVRGRRVSAGKADMPTKTPVAIASRARGSALAVARTCRSPEVRIACPASRPSGTTPNALPHIVLRSVTGARRQFGARFGAYVGGERRRQPRGVVVRWDVVQVAHRRLDISVAHPRLDLPQIDTPGRTLRPERVAQVVEDDWVVSHHALRVGVVRGLDITEVTQPRPLKRRV